MGVVITEGEFVKDRTKEEIDNKNKEFEAMLREKPNGNKSKTEEDMTVMLVEQPDRGVKIGVVGSGQCGSKLAEEFYKNGYNVMVVNTALQDLKLINIPEKQKLFLDYAVVGGAAKNLDNGKAAAEMYSEAILEMMKENFEDCSVLMLISSGGGGSGSGSCETIVNIMTQMGKPISVLYVLPLSSEDALAKSNSIQTLAGLASLAQADVINSLMIVDNSKIELINPGLSMADFWKEANRAIVEPLHLFNKLSAIPSEYTSLDAMDFVKLFIGTGDCALYGAIDVENYCDENSIAESILTTLKNGLLCDDFDLSQTRSAGIIMTGNKNVLQKVQASSLEFGFAMASKVCSDSVNLYRGVYEVQDQEDVLHIYSFFSGLGLPAARVAELKAESDKNMGILKGKENNRATSMNIDLGKTKTVSAADAMHKKIMNKQSAMGKLIGNSKGMIDKRRK